MTTRSKRRAKAAKPELVPMGKYLTIPMNQLVLSPSNVRNIYGPDGITALAGSIARRGLLQSLAVRLALPEDLPDGTYEVIAGGRRFRAMEMLIAEGRMAEDAPIPCVLKSDGDAIDDSLAENNDREALHPLDEFRAFKAMRDNGRADDDIAAAYGVTPAVVRQRLRLANASPVLLQAYQDDEIELETLMAYCVVTDHARQERVFQSVSDSGNDYPAQIKRLLTEATVPAHDKRVKFVGLEAYEAAGGAVLRDLFDEEHQGYLQDPELLERLVAEKLASLRDAELSAGWKWAVAAVEQDYAVRRGFDRVSPLAIQRTAEQDARLLEVDARLAELREADGLSDEDEAELLRLEDEEESLTDGDELFSAEDMARAGVFITLDWDGRPSMARGYIRPEDSDIVGPASTPSAAENGNESEPIAKKLPDNLVQDLTVLRTAALRDAMAHDYGVAFLAVLHVMCLSHFYRANGASALQITLSDSFTTAPGLESFAPVTAFDKRQAALRGVLPKHPDDLWSALLALDESTQKQLFAHCAGASVNAVRQYPHQQRAAQIAQSHQLQEALGLHMVATGWTATVGSYLGRVSKEHILAAVREARGDDFATVIAPLKKAAMAEEAERLLTGTGWLPEPMRGRPLPVTAMDADASSSSTPVEEIVAAA